MRARQELRVLHPGKVFLEHSLKCAKPSAVLGGRGNGQLEGELLPLGSAAPAEVSQASDCAGWT